MHHLQSFQFLYTLILQISTGICNPVILPLKLPLNPLDPHFTSYSGKILWPTIGESFLCIIPHLLCSLSFVYSFEKCSSSQIQLSSYPHLHL